MKKVPLTSLIANNSKDKETDKKAIVSVLQQYKETSFTYREIAKLLHWQEPVRVMRRMSELIEESKAVITGVKKDLYSNRPCQTYQFNLNQ